MPDSAVPAKPVPGQSVARAFDGAIEFRAATASEPEAFRMSLTSEEPYLRWWGTEILDHSEGAVDLSRAKDGIPMLFGHDAWNLGTLVGRIHNLRIERGRLVGDARFFDDEDGARVRAKVQQGHREVSASYVIDKMVLEKQDETGETYRVTRWTLLEGSIVSVPADHTVGVGRQQFSSATPSPALAVSQPPPQETRTMSDTAAPAIEVSPQPRPTPDASEILRSDQARRDSIEALGRAHNQEAFAAEACRSGLPLDQFKLQLLDRVGQSPKLATPASDIGLTGRENERYSVLRAIRAMVDRDWKNAGFERECHQAICQRAGVGESPNGGFFVPYQVQKRDLTAGTGTAGGYLVATDILGADFIELLRNRTIVAQLGATLLTGLVGNVTVPKQTAGSTAYWLTNEGTAITESQQTLGQLALSPKNVGAYTEISRQLMMQSSPSADAMVMRDLARVLAIAIDLAALEGSGSSGQPTGIANTASIGSVTGTSLAWAGVLEFQTDVAGSNALAANCAYTTTPSVAALLAARARFSNTDTPLWEGNILDGRMGGFRAVSTLQLTAASMIFGDFSQVVVGEWGMLEIALNPYANFAAAISGIRAIQTVDVGVRYAGAFSRATSIT